MIATRRAILLSGAAVATLAAAQPSLAQLMMGGVGQGDAGGGALWPQQDLTIGPTSLAAGSSAAGGSTWIIGGYPVNRTGTLQQVQIRAGASAAVKIKRLTRAGNVFTWVSEQTVNVVAGTNTFSVAGSTLSAQAFNASDYIALYSATSNFLQYLTPALSGTEYYSVSGDITTSTTVGVATAPSSGIQLQCNFTIRTAATAAAAIVGPLLNAGLSQTPAAGAGNLAVNTNYFDDTPMPTPCRIETIEAYGSTAAYVLIQVMKPSAAGFTLDRVFRLSLVSGDKVYVAGTDFPIDVVVPAGGIIGTWAGMAGLTSGSGTYNRSYRYLDATVSTGIYPATAVPAFATIANTSSLAAQIKFGIRRTQPDVLSSVRVDKLFSSTLDQDWNATGWSISGGKAVNSATGLGNLLAFREAGYYDGVIEVWAAFTTGADEIAIARQPMASGDNLGSVWTINQSTGLFAIRNLWDGTSTLPAVAQSKTTTLNPMVTGRQYKFTLAKTGRTQTLTITDTTNSATDQQQWLGIGAPTGVNGSTRQTAGQCVGRPCVAATAGTLNVFEAKFTTYAAPTAMLFGDSITEAAGATVDANGWSYLTRANLATPGAALISPHAGDTSTPTLARLEYETRQYLPQFVVILIGTNDTVYATWQANMQVMLNRIAACGATPIICTMPPRTDQLWIEQQGNPWIVANVPAGQVARFDIALTTGGTGLSANQNTSLFISDLIHPNDTGHAAMYNRLRSDCPQLFATV